MDNTEEVIINALAGIPSGKGDRRLAVIDEIKHSLQMNGIEFDDRKLVLEGGMVIYDGFTMYEPPKVPKKFYRTSKHAKARRQRHG